MEVSFASQSPVVVVVGIVVTIVAIVVLNTVIAASPSLSAVSSQVDNNAAVYRSSFGSLAGMPSVWESFSRVFIIMATVLGRSVGCTGVGVSESVLHPPADHVGMFSTALG